jgi:protoporphyrinogen oxidase
MISLASLGVVGISGIKFLKTTFSSKRIPGRMIGASFDRGHLLIKNNFEKPTREIEISTVIVGGGISGLSAAYTFTQNNFFDYILLELEDKVGGNSSSAENKITPFPLGAHYIPLLSEESKLAKKLFEELGIIEGHDKHDLPIYNEYYVCSDPHERLLIHGRWQNGLIPEEGIPETDKKEIKEFLDKVSELKNLKGKDNKRAFAIPMEESSTDSKFKKLDDISMKTYLKQNDFNSKYLEWYINYCCRDDFGMTIENISAWAGIHYFAARNGKGSEISTTDIITWPEGNGWIVNKLYSKIKKNCLNGKIVFNIENMNEDGKDFTYVDYYDVKSKAVTRIKTRKIIYAAPRFTAFRTIKSWRVNRPSWANKLEYSPWMVANISLSNKPVSSEIPLSWDNVNFDGRSLGYVVATHQNLKSKQEKSVLTLYWPLTDRDSRQARTKALGKSHQQWTSEIIKELDAMHPEIESLITNIDVCLWGHAMIKPNVGFIWGNERENMNKHFNNIYFAHSDMSGFSIFEEAHYRGVKASEKVLKELNNG